MAFCPLVVPLLPLQVLETAMIVSEVALIRGICMFSKENCYGGCLCLLRKALWV